MNVQVKIALLTPLACAVWLILFLLDVQLKNILEKEPICPSSASLFIKQQFTN
jgi:hypothetical protein